MKVSYKWLTAFFDKSIPQPEKLAELFTFHSFEIEEVVKVGDDTVIDAKILPDRAPYLLSHLGIAEEVSVLTDLELRKKDIAKKEITSTYPLNVIIEDEKFCSRYSARVIENIKVVESDKEVRELLEAIGARAINAVVDATNFVMFDLGEPLHAFDADKVKGGIKVRYAKEDEKITLLDGKEVTLTTNDSVIADDVGPLAIAGVKGGKRAEVTSSTKNIILEAANFNPVAVRRTAVRTGIRNESSKRFENAITPEITIHALERVTDMIVASSSDAKVGEIIDIYPYPLTPHSTTVAPRKIRDSLGLNIPDSEIISILKKLQIEVLEKGDELVLTIPQRRRDLVIPEDIVEEVGRIHGYGNIPSVLPPKIATPKPHKDFYITEQIKTLLIENGFSEVYLYTLTNKGDYEIVYPLASDKSFLRKGLLKGLENSLKENSQNAPLLGLQKIKIFEVGAVFTKDGEHMSLALGVKHIKKEKGNSPTNDLENILNLLREKCGGEPNDFVTEKGDGCIAINLTEYIKTLEMPNDAILAYQTPNLVQYKPYSQYPFVLRDIAVFVSQDVEPHEVLEIINKHGGELLVRRDLFDIFEKKFPDGTVKKSIAYHLVFQSHERTLTDSEVSEIMSRITTEMTKKGWEVR